MRKLLFFSIITLLTFTLMGCNSYSNNLPLEMIAFNSLSEDEQSLIPVSPKDSVVEKINVTSDVEKFLDDDYNKAQVYSVIFNNTENESNGNLVVFIDADNEEVVGKGYAKK